MTERNDDRGVTDPFLSRIALPSMEERDPQALRPMLWPIASPRVRKTLVGKLEDLEDHHFVSKVFAGILAGAVFLAGGITLLMVLRHLLPWEVEGYVFGGAFTVLFVALTLVADRYRPPTPREVYYAAHTGGGEAHRGDRPVGRVLRTLLFGPYLVSVAYRKLLEPPPPTDEAVLDVALRLLPVLHEPLPLHQAELAGIASRDEIRQASLLLHALRLADLVRGPGNVVLLTPRSACAQLLRDGSAPAAGADEAEAEAAVAGDDQSPWLEMDPDQVQTSEIDTVELVRQGEELGLQSTDMLSSEWPPEPEQSEDSDDES